MKKTLIFGIVFLILLIFIIGCAQQIQEKTEIQPSAPEKIIKEKPEQTVLPETPQESLEEIVQGPKLSETKEIPSSYHIENVQHYREDNFCYGAGAMMLVRYNGLTEQEVQDYRKTVKSGPGGPPDIFMGFMKHGLIDKVKIGYSKNYIKEYADFYNHQLLKSPEQTILFNDKDEALEHLKKLVSSDILVLVIAHHGNHYLIVTGYDENHIYFNDPGVDDGYDYGGGQYKEQSKMTIDQFVEQWTVSRFEGGGIGFPGDYGMIWLEE